MFFYLHDFKDIFSIYHQCFYDSSLGFYIDGCYAHFHGYFHCVVDG
jgi:hypothetical protein